MSIPAFTQFFTGEILTATVLNQFPTAAVASFAAIDRTNMGPNGIDASSIIPTTVTAATFGGPVGYKFNPNAVGQIPLTLAAPSGQTVAIFNTTLNAQNVWGVDSAGRAFGNTWQLQGSATVGVGTLHWAGLGTPDGWFFNIPSATTNGWRFFVNNATVVGSLTPAGVLLTASQVTPGVGGTIGTASIYSGTGSPSGSLSAPNGSLFLRFDGGANTHLYINTTGSNATGTTWTAVTD